MLFNLIRFMKKLKIIIDTNVIVSAKLSKRGASYKLVSLLENTDIFEIAISVPLFVEYEYALSKLNFTQDEIDDYLGWISVNSNHKKIYYLWRPYLSDKKDDCVLEAALNSGSEFIITYNKNDFKNVEIFNIEILTPKEFLVLIGVI